MSVKQKENNTPMVHSNSIPYSDALNVKDKLHIKHFNLNIVIVKGKQLTLKLKHFYLKLNSVKAETTQTQRKNKQKKNYNDQHFKINKQKGEKYTQRNKKNKRVKVTLFKLKYSLNLNMFWVGLFMF